MRIVDEQEQHSLIGRCRKQCERGRAKRKTVGWARRSQGEGATNQLLLRFGQLA
jgi:hypothetical protein